VVHPGLDLGPYPRMEPCFVGTKSFVSQGPQDRSEYQSVLDTLTEGESRSKSMEWMLVTDEILVAHYCEREHIEHRHPVMSPSCLIGCDFRGKAIYCD
jgi:hypothetical protein